MPLPDFLPPWVWMWGISLLILGALKHLTLRAVPWQLATRGRRVAYLSVWPGLDARAFLLTPPNDVEPPPQGALAWSIAKIAGGALLLWGVVPRVPENLWLMRGWLGMAAVVTLLHFGLFDLQSVLWRRAGVDARPLMRNPAASRSLAEFWGRRWNTAFRDVTHRFLFAPLREHVRPSTALMLGFLASGLVHELVVSVPAGAGYGGPTLYFVLQGAALLLERSRTGRRLGLGRGARGRLFTLLVVAPPAFVLFHPPFVRVVVLPFLGFLGAG